MIKEFVQLNKFVCICVEFEAAICWGSQAHPNLPSWFHKQEGGKLIKELKDPATGQVPKETAREWHDIWKDEQGGFIDPSLLPELLMPWWLAPTDMGCGTLDCHPEYKEDQPCQE